jgi:hypothetical protein
MMNDFSLLVLREVRASGYHGKKKIRLEFVTSLV